MIRYGTMLALAAMVGLTLIGCPPAKEDSDVDMPITMPSGTSTSNGDTDAGAMTVAANDLFAANCAKCHGDDGAGGQGPGKGPDLTAVGAEHSADEVAEIIRDGRDAMPSFASQLSDEEITALADYLTSGMSSGDDAAMSGGDAADGDGHVHGGDEDSDEESGDDEDTDGEDSAE